MAKFDPVIKWTGSKRSHAENIIQYFPTKMGTYYEPFVRESLYVKNVKKPLKDRPVNQLF